MERMSPGALVAERFEIERLASAGGMGTVYRARDVRGGGHVALKMLRAGGHDEGLRFEREARILAQLHHPGIVRYVDHGQTDAGVAWLAMEWLDGEDLGARLKRGRLSLDEVATLGRVAAEALAAAHARGVVHRDVKPSNLFLPGRAIERAKVIDFGIARGTEELIATLSGVVMGTPAYMAPEQARGAPDVDARADIFSLGCVLYECLAGRPPFEGRHAMAVLAKILFEEAPALRGLRPDVPPALEALVARMLAKKPGGAAGGRRRGGRGAPGSGRGGPGGRAPAGADGEGAAAGERHRRRDARAAGGGDGRARGVARRPERAGARGRALRRAGGGAGGRIARGRAGGQRRRHGSGRERRALRPGDARGALAGAAGGGHRARDPGGRAAPRGGDRSGRGPAARRAARRRGAGRRAHRRRRGDRGAPRRPLRAGRRRPPARAAGRARGGAGRGAQPARQAHALRRPRPRDRRARGRPRRVRGGVGRARRAAHRPAGHRQVARRPRAPGAGAEERGGPRDPGGARGCHERRVLVAPAGAARGARGRAHPRGRAGGPAGQAPRPRRRAAPG